MRRIFLLASLVLACSLLPSPRADASPPVVDEVALLAPLAPLAAVVASPLATVTSTSSAVLEVAKVAALNVVLDPTVWGIVLFIVVALIAKKSATTATYIQSAIAMAFHIVDDLNATGKLPAGANKVAVAMQKFDDLLAVKNITLTDELQELAKAAWSAMHGQQTSASTTVVAALKTAVASPAPSPTPAVLKPA